MYGSYADALFTALDDELWHVERQLHDMDNGGPGTDEHRRLLEGRKATLERRLNEIARGDDDLPPAPGREAA